MKTQPYWKLSVFAAASPELRRYSSTAGTAVQQVHHTLVLDLCVRDVLDVYTAGTAKIVDVLDVYTAGTAEIQQGTA